jgi:hypothetical protein
MAAFWDLRKPAAKVAGSVGFDHLKALKGWQSSQSDANAKF